MTRWITQVGFLLLRRGRLILAASSLVIACAPSNPAASNLPATPCQPTNVQMVPPQEVMDFMVSHSTSSATPPPREEWARMGNWFGDDELWLLLPSEGRVPGSDIKIATYRMRAGRITISGRRLDGVGTIKGVASAGYGDLGFQPTGLTFSSAGCWDVAYRVGDHELHVTLRSE
jgi:hypothetical protein